MNQLHQSAIIAIGTEVTCGDLIDSNSAWISKRLLEYGIEAVLHLSVPDDPEKIKKALDFAKDQVPSIFLTGGLGPTVDDMTREVVADWSQKPLEFHSESWQRVEDRLNSRKTPILDRHRQQAHFPQGAQILPNAIGTADGFKLTVGSNQLYILPGPPRELHGIWSDHIMPELSEKYLLNPPLVIDRWKVFAVPESDIAEKLEPLVNHPDIRLAFRASFPYVEVKLIYPHRIKSEAEEIHKKLDAIIQEWPTSRTDRNSDHEFEELLLMVPSVSVHDSVSHGAFLSQIHETFRNLSPHGKTFNFESAQQHDPNGLTIKIEKESEGENVKLSLAMADEQFETSIEVPEVFKERHTRRFAFVAEKVLLETNQWLKSKVPTI